MTKLERHTLNQRVYAQLRKMLLQGDIALGAQLDERELAEQLGVSRTPLREAIAHLVREGIVEYRPYRGNFVRKLTAKQVNDLYLVRKELESLAVRLAVPKLSQEDIECVRTILDMMEDALMRGDIEGFSEADRRFHDLVIQATENETLIEALNRLAMQVQMVRVYANRNRELVERTQRERPQVLAALERRDVAEAARLMEEHIDGVRCAVVAHIKAREQAELVQARDGNMDV